MITGMKDYWKDQTLPTISNFYCVTIVQFGTKIRWVYVASSRSKSFGVKDSFLFEYHISKYREFTLKNKTVENMLPLSYTFLY